MTASAPSLVDIQMRARIYPSYLLPCGGTALSLFCAGYHGWNDTIHFQRQHMTTTCVDTDKDKLWEMATVYPAGWEFVVEDAWKFADYSAEDGRMWDVVSVDTYLGDATDRSLADLSVWTRLARELVTVTAPLHGSVDPPNGWRAFAFPRSTSAEWMVLQRD